MAAEGCGVPFPSGVATPFAGVFATLGHPSPTGTILAGSLASSGSLAATGNDVSEAPLALIPLKGALASYGYLAVFVFVGIESLGFPFPGETMLVTDRDRVVGQRGDVGDFERMEDRMTRAGHSVVLEVVERLLAGVADPQGLTGGGAEAAQLTCVG